MDRAFLEGVGVTDKETINKILDQNGVEVSTLNTRIKAKDTEITTLRSDLAAANGKVAELEKVDVKDLQHQLEQEKAGRKTDRRNFALNAALASAGCTDADYIRYKLGDSVKYTDDDKLQDAEQAVKDWREKYPKWFGDGSNDGDNNPSGTGSNGNFNRDRGNTAAKDNPYTKEGWNLTAQMELEAKDPARAKKLEAEASARK